MAKNKCICKSCKKEVAYSKLPIQCDHCNLWFHGTCEKLNNKSWKLLGNSQTNWYCTQCYLSMFPFSTINDEDLEYLLKGVDDNLIELFEKCMKFENKCVENPWCSDLTNENINENIYLKNEYECKYITHDGLYNMAHDINTHFSIIHFNSRSLI